VGVSYVALDYSTDSGSTWTSIDSSETNDGSFSWTVPDALTNSARVKVTAYDAAGNSGYDTSNANFTVQSGAADDNYEENDTLAAAHDLSSNEQTWLSTINGYGIQADSDWYRIEVTPGDERVLVDLRFTHSEGDIDVALYDSAGNFLTVSESMDDNEYIDHIVPNRWNILLYKSVLRGSRQSIRPMVG